jgi:hypothetical protein
MATKARLQTKMSRLSTSFANTSIGCSAAMATGAVALRRQAPRPAPALGLAPGRQTT